MQNKLPVWFWLFLAAAMTAVPLFGYKWDSSQRSNIIQIMLILAFIVLGASAVVLLIDWAAYRVPIAIENYQAASVAGQVRLERAEAARIEAIGRLPVEIQKQYFEGSIKPKYYWIMEILRQVNPDTLEFPSQHELASGSAEQMRIKEAADLLCDRFGLLTRRRGRTYVFLNKSKLDKAWKLAEGSEL